METLIREAKPSDAKSLLNIYLPYVEDAPVSFEYELPKEDEFRQRIIQTLTRFPYLVAETEGEIAGYAYAGPHRTRYAYRWSVDVTVYVSSECQRKGFGKKLYLNLFEILRRQGFVNAFAGITLPNEGSVGLHESLGFKKIGIYKNVGFKHDRWWDVGWWQLILQKVGDPMELIPFPDLNYNSE